jgi:hypothetical protein
MKLNVNTDDTVVMTNKLEKLHRSAFPSAVRGTLNSVAFLMKQKTLLNVTEKTFTTRQKNFFKANSKVFQAKGFEVRTMVATVGMVEGGLKGGNNYAVKDLEQQERGGNIGGRAFIPISEGARTSKSINRNVKKKQRLSSIKSIVDARNVSGKNSKEKFVKSAIHAGVNGYVLNADSVNGERTLMHIKKIGRNGRGTSIGATPVYTYKKGRKIKVKATRFMERSGEITARSMNQIYQKEGQRQIERLMNKR